MTKPRVRKHPNPDNPPRPDATDGGADEFAREMRDVTRLLPDVRGRISGGRRPISAPHPAGKPMADPVDGPLEAFTAPGVDRRELRKLKRGDYVAGDRTDLHGMTAVDACARAGRFLEDSRHRGYRCVCIIHGRGLHSEGRTPVLKARVRAFLSSHRSVLAYSDAPKSDGGMGAVYVLLRS
jgi:DNA-nicking Smr family endonuclease